ncbi:conserved hypothetical protein [Candidatus Magnetomoraceae bacterium gMMP-1]
MIEQDPYLETIKKQWEHIRKLYKMFPDRETIIEIRIHPLEIFACNYKQYKENMNEQSKRIITKQYEESLLKNEIIVFVKDQIKRKLKSYSLPIDYDKHE